MYSRFDFEIKVKIIKKIIIGEYFPNSADSTTLLTSALGHLRV